MGQELLQKIQELAPQISSEPLLRVYHQPEEGALPLRCIKNVADKVVKDGGDFRFGWTFNSCYEPDYGMYLIANHHAVWRAPDSTLIDITPYNPSDQPLTWDNRNDVILLVDASAQPVMSTCSLGDDELTPISVPLPSKYFALNHSQGLKEYLKELTEKEYKEFQEICEGRYNPYQNPNNTIFT